MKTFMTAAALSFGMAGAALAADPIEGMWKTEPDDGIFYHVLMKPCGNAYCGEFRKKFENGQEVSSPVIGRNAVFDMVPQGGGEYKGKAWRPSNDKVYTGSGTLSGDVLRVGGQILGGLIKVRQTWTRVR